MSLLEENVKLFIGVFFSFKAYKYIIIKRNSSSDSLCDEIQFVSDVAYYKFVLLLFSCDTKN